MSRLTNGAEMEKLPARDTRRVQINGGGIPQASLKDVVRPKDHFEMAGLKMLRPSSVLDKTKPSIRVLDVAEARTAAREIVYGATPWIQQVPDVVLTFVTGNTHFDQWRRDDMRSALQGGMIKLMSSLNMVIFDDGLDYGFSRILGDVALEEETLKTMTSRNSGGGSRPPLIGIVPASRMQEEEYPSEMGRLDDSSSLFTSEDNVGRLPLNPNHSRYVFIPNQTYREAGLIRVALEKTIQNELSSRASAGNSGSGRQTIPMVAFIFQGELDDLDRIRAYVENGVPLVVMEGCGGLGDVIAGAVTDSAELDGDRLRGAIDQKLHKTFPLLKNSDQGSTEAVGLILDVLRMSQGENGTQLLSVVNCRLIETFATLNSAVLKSAINSSSANASPELFAAFMALAVKCNRPDIATSMLLSRQPWSNMELPPRAFEQALLIPGRESFIDCYLMQQFPVRQYLSHLKLLKLFRESKDPQFFSEHIWENILRYSQAAPIGPDFIITDLNRLIKKLTGIHNYIDVYGLSAAAFGEKTELDPVTEERKAMNALLVFAVLYNRPNLAKVLIKYSQEPLLQTLFADSLFHGLYRNISHVAMAETVQKTSGMFAQIATDLLDKGVSVSPVRGHAILTQRFADFNDKTPLEMAYDTNNKQFVAHANVQTWLDQYYFNFIKVKGDMDNLKLFLSAIFIFPMYLWLTFPRLRRSGPAPQEDDVIFRPKNPNDAEKILSKVKRIQSGEQGADHSVRAQEHPPFMDMLSAVWAAPVVRFYTWHLFYWLFIILICVDIMLPPCRFEGVDIAVFVITISMWCELVTRTIYDMQRHRRLNWVERSYDLICQTVFNILFFLYRIAPYRYDHPFAGRVILAFGVMYYCYRVWGWFYYMEKTIGPLIRQTVLMFSMDLSRWIILVAPFLIATSLIFMGVINPDWPATGDDWRHMIYRGIFTLFGAFGYELEYITPCEKNRINPNITHGPNWAHPGAYPADRCWSGDYNAYTCGTVSFWSYFFVIQYYVFLKLGMGNMLTAFYVTRNLAAARQGPSVWKYHRCRIILDYAGRTSLPPPFYAIGYIYMMIKYCSKPKGQKGAYIDDDVAGIDHGGGDTYAYWKGLVMEYFRGKEQQEAAARIPAQQLESLSAIQDSVVTLSKKLASADRKVLEVEESTKKTGAHVHDTAAQMKQSKASTLTEVAQPWPHKLARTSPYPGTTITRFFVPIDKTEWREPFEEYRPESYTKDASNRLSQLQMDDRTSLRSKDSSGDLANYDGYKRSVSVAGNLDDADTEPRGSWIAIDSPTDRDGIPTNPYGRTGLQGRGSLPKLGPNQKVYMLITSRLPNVQGFRYLVHRTPNKVPILPQSFVTNEMSEFAVGCLLLDAFLFDSNALTAKELNLNEIESLDSMYQVVESSLRARLANIIENFGRRPIALREMYRGYCDSPLNTDNAWLEVVVFHLTLPQFGIDKFTNYKYQVYSPDSGLPDFEGAILRQFSLENS